MADREKERRLAAIEEARVHARALGGPLGILITRELDLQSEIVREGVTQESRQSIGYYLDSMSQERQLAWSRETNQQQNLLSYARNEALEGTLRSMLEGLNGNGGAAMASGGERLDQAETPGSGINVQVPTNTLAVYGGQAIVGFNPTTAGSDLNSQVMAPQSLAHLNCALCATLNGDQLMQHIVVMHWGATFLQQPADAGTSAAGVDASAAAPLGATPVSIAAPPTYSSAAFAGGLLPNGTAPLQPPTDIPSTSVLVTDGAASAAAPVGTPVSIAAPHTHPVYSSTSFDGRLPNGAASHQLPAASPSTSSLASDLVAASAAAPLMPTPVHIAAPPPSPVNATDEVAASSAVHPTSILMANPPPGIATHSAATVVSALPATTAHVTYAGATFAAPVTISLDEFRANYAATQVGIPAAAAAAVPDASAPPPPPPSTPAFTAPAAAAPTDPASEDWTGHISYVHRGEQLPNFTHSTAQTSAPLNRPLQERVTDNTPVPSTDVQPPAKRARPFARATIKVENAKEVQNANPTTSLLAAAAVASSAAAIPIDQTAPGVPNNSFDLCRVKTEVADEYETNANRSAPVATTSSSTAFASSGMNLTLLAARPGETAAIHSNLHLATLAGANNVGDKGSGSTAQMEGRHSCTVCAERFRTSSAKKAHLRCVHGVTCPICGKKLTNKNSLRKHKKVVHAEGKHGPNQMSDDEENAWSLSFLRTLAATPFSGAFICQVCQRPFTTLRGLNMHMVVHDDKQCPHCLKQIAHLSVAEHIKIHHPEQATVEMAGNNDAMEEEVACTSSRINDECSPEM